MNDEQAISFIIRIMTLGDAVHWDCTLMFRNGVLHQTMAIVCEWPGIVREGCYMLQHWDS